MNYGSGPGEGGGPGQAAGGLGINLEAVIRATVSALVSAAMAGSADITRAAVEARLDTVETGDRFLDVIKSHLRHIYGVATKDEVPDIWEEVARARTVETKMDLLTQFLQTDLSEC